MVGMTKPFCFIILLISLAHASARPGFEPMVMDAFGMDSSNNESSTAFICDTCLEASREAKKALADPKLFEKVSILSNEVCRILPTDLGEKCLKVSETYLHQTKTSLKELFNEENLCDSNGSCLERTSLATNNDLMEELENIDCMDCRKAAKDLFLKLKRPKNKSWIIESLLQSCEEAGTDTNECKQQIDEYAPMFLSKLMRIKTQDMCTSLGFCDENVSL